MDMTDKRVVLSHIIRENGKIRVSFFDFIILESLKLSSFFKIMSLYDNGIGYSKILSYQKTHDNIYIESLEI